MRFEWSPGRLDRRYLGYRTAFDVAFLLAMPDGTEGVIGIEMKYHEVAEVEKAPSRLRLTRYREVTEVAERDGVFRPGTLEAVVGTPRQQIWRDHLLALSMSQHPHRRWSWVRFAIVYPALNGSIAAAVGGYKEVVQRPGPPLRRPWRISSTPRGRSTRVPPCCFGRGISGA